MTVCSLRSPVIIVLHREEKKNEEEGDEDEERDKYNNLNACERDVVCVRLPWIAISSF